MATGNSLVTSPLAAAASPATEAGRHETDLPHLGVHGAPTKTPRTTRANKRGVNFVTRLGKKRYVEKRYVD